MVEIVPSEIHYIPDVRPPIPVFEHKLVAEAHWNNWEIQLDCSWFISSDLAWLSKWFLFPSRSDFPTFDGSACLNVELLIRFPRSSLPDENIAAGFTDALGSWDEFDIKFLFGQLEYALHLLLSCIIAAGLTGPVGIRDDLQSSRPCTYSGEANIFHNSPSSRSESAILSAES